MSVKDRLPLIEGIWQMLEENMLHEGEREISFRKADQLRTKKYSEQTKSLDDFKNRKMDSNQKCQP
jgi:hypothetical protein